MKECDKQSTIIVNVEPFISNKAGVGTVAYEVTKKLRAINCSKFRLVLFTPINLPEFSDVKQQIIPNFPKLIGFSSIRLFLIFPIFAYLHKAKYFVEFTHFGPFNLLKSTKRITYIHDLTPLTHAQFHTFAGSFLQKLFLKRILKNAHLIITNSKNTKNDLTQMFPTTSNRSKCIYLGVSDDFFPDYSFNAIKKYAIEKPYFLFVGTIEPRKNLDLLLEAFKKINTQQKGKFNLVVVGKLGWKYTQTMQKINDHPFKEDIIITGYASVSDLNQLYTHSIALIYPSIYEGFGLPIVEAYKCNTKSIVSHNSSLIEVGEICNSIFFSTNDEESLVSAIYECLASNQTNSININYFSWDNHTTKLLEYICSLK